jgi:antitoxin StbD
MNSPFQRIEADLAISVSDLKKNPTATFERARSQAVAVLNHNRVIGYVISPEAYDGFLEMAEDLEDIAEINRTKDDALVPVKLDGV